MTSRYVAAGLRVAQELGGIAVTVQRPGLYPARKTVLSCGGRNLCIVETGWASMEIAEPGDNVLEFRKTAEEVIG